MRVASFRVIVVADRDDHGPAHARAVGEAEST
jgi:hypothetical protein